MITKSTPGPWSTSSIPGDNYVMGPNHSTVAIVPGWNGISHQEWEANKQLIASAPALKSENEHMRACIGEALIMAENLRKATGDAIPGAICYTLRAALEQAQAEKGQS